ncbi:hypothetical protein [Pectinatus cerevisiiphilus]|uniref:Uncharacterized protein n=1 Tax=Pectinatus cerevisiiphilus TaxID=86956 RepID=A0A4R3KFS5_9FIRM|nr:hypothetical protein [Pectinatus cerevisiiphilus]TCS82060.1 hypothetical protein EDC37_101233 [Pectinatus cerevisiiphilus]
MSMINRSQGSIFSIAGKALSSPNSILKAKSSLAQNKQQADYKVDVDIKGDTVKDKLFRKRVQLLEESNKKNHIVKTTNVDTLSAGSSADTPLINNADISLLMEILKKSSSTENTAGTQSNYYDDNLQALSDYLNSTDKPIIDITAKGQKPTEEAVAFSTTIGGKNVILRYDKSTLTTNESNLAFTANGIDAKVLIELGGKAPAENDMISSVNNAFKELGNRMSEFKAMELNGQLGTGCASEILEIHLNNIAVAINGYNKYYDDKSVFDTIIDGLQMAKQSLFNDSVVKNDSKKMSVVGTTKLIDYITDMFKKGKNGTLLSESNYWDDSNTILSSEFGGDSGGSLVTVDDKLLSWKYIEYKKRFMAELGNQTPDEKNNILLKSLQDTNGKVDYVKWFKSLLTPFKDAYHK